MAHRYFTQNIGQNTACITGDDANHLARVLRAQPGETLTLCNGSGTDYTAVITSVTPAEIHLNIVESHPTNAEPTLYAGVYLGYAKGQKLEWALQKCVELGASFIQPFFSSKCLVKPKNEEEKNRRYTRIAHEAAKQAGRGILPEVALPVSFDACLQLAVQNGPALFLYEGGGMPIANAIAGQNQVAIITGPEAGFTPAEAEQAQNAGCIPISLGPRILRCETAPMAALAAAMAISGNLQ